VSFGEPLTEGVAAEFGQGAGFGPVAQGAHGDGFDGEVVGERGHFDGGAPEEGSGGEDGEAAEGRGAGRENVGAFGFVAQAHEKIGEGDGHRADAVAGTAERAGFGELCVFGEALGEEERGEDGADRPSVGRAVCVAGGLTIDRADVLAGGGIGSVSRRAAE